MLLSLCSKYFSEDPRQWAVILAVFAFMVSAPAPLCLASGSTLPKQEVPSITITKEQNGQQIAVPAGTRIVVELSLLGSAGYGWHIEKPDSDLLRFLQEETRPMDATGRVGGPVLGRWHFLAVKQGIASIRMNYYRVWEGPATASDHFAVMIKVEQEIRQ